MQQKQRNLGRPRHDQLSKPTKTIILETATALFLQNGFKLVSMDDVAKACDITKATIYYYYATKADLYTDCMIEMMLRIRERISNILATNEPLKTRLCQLIKIHLSATVDIDLNNFMKDAKVNLSEEQQEQMEQLEEKMYEEIEKVFIESMEKGEIPPYDSKFITQIFITMLNVGNYRDSQGKTIFGSIDEMADQIVEFFWKGLGI